MPVLTSRVALGNRSTLSRQTAKPRRLSLQIQSLEDRVVLSPSTIDYRVQANSVGVEGAAVMIIGNGSQSGFGGTDSQGMTTLPTPLPPWYGIGGTELWDAKVILPPGYEFYQNEEFATGGPYWNGTDVFNAVTLAVIDPPTPLCPDGTCIVPGTTLMPQPSEQNAMAYGAGSAVSDSGVRYFDGVARVTDTDLVSDGFGLPWSQTRSWSNGVQYGGFGVHSLSGYPYYVAGAGTSSHSLNQRLGKGWVNNMMPRVRFFGDDFYLTGTSNSGMYFDKTGTNTWSPGLYHQTTASIVSGELILIDEKGNQTVFYDNAASPSNLRGQLKRYVGANGETVSVHEYTNKGDIAEMRRGTGSDVESWVYRYGTGDIMSWHMTGVTLRRSADTGSTWQEIRAVEYLYTDWDTPDSPAFQLKAAVVHDGGLTAPAVETKYYRYYSHGDANGTRGDLKYVVSSKSFDRLAAAHGVDIDSVDSLSDAQVAVYADAYFEYTSNRRVKKIVSQGEGCSVCAGGLGSFEYAYHTNPSWAAAAAPSDDPNRFGEWRVRTTETLPDGNQNIVYLNNLGQAILKVFKNGSGQEWSTFNKFDSQGRVIWTAGAETVMGRGEQYADLLHRVNGNFEFLSDDAGLVSGINYAAATTATSSDPGDVKGYFKSAYRRQGEMGAGYEIVSSAKYLSRMANGITIYPLATESAHDVAPVGQTSTDDFSSLTGWTFIGGSWRESGGIASQSDSGDGSIKAAVLNDPALSANQEIVASVRVDSWTAGTYARAGVSVRTSATTGQGYGLVFNGTNQVRFVNDGVTLSSPYTFNWSVGTWYKFRLRAEGSMLYGKVWDASQSEPSAWMYTLAGWGHKPTGSPGLNGGAAMAGQGNSTVSFKDVQVSETTYPALSTPTAADDFSSIDGWTMVSGRWVESGGVLSQSETFDNGGASRTAVLADTSWGSDQEIVASVRVDTWTAGSSSKAGVSVRTDAATGRGYSLVFAYTNEVRLLNDGVDWGAALSFTWSTGTWYKFRLMIQSDVLYGKVWDASQTEPSSWQLTKSGWTSKPSGSPGLLGGATRPGYGNAVASFDDVQATSGSTSAGDTFTASAAGAGWTLAGGGSWRSTGGLMSQTNTAVSNGKTAVLADRTWGADQEILASVRVDTWTAGVYARAGVAVRSHPTTGLGYGLVFNGTNQVRFLDDGVGWGNSYAFTWSTGTWYKFRLRIEGETLYGKVWDASQSEPSSWLYTQTGWGSKASGSPALNGGAAANSQGNSTASFDDVSVAGSPAPTGTTASYSKPFSAITPGAGWTMGGGGAWQSLNGILAQTNTVNSNGKVAVVAGSTWGPDQEILASVRVDTWTAGIQARAGVNVRTNPVTARGYGLVFNGTNQVRFVNDGVGWGNSYSFTWSTGTWYKFRLRAEGTTLLGKVWAANQSEPTAWMFRQDGWADKPGGAPALNGGAAQSGQGNSTASFDDVIALNLVPESGRTVTRSYTWNSGAAGLQPKTATATLPVVATFQNGSGTADAATTVFNERGQPIWTKDGEGFLRYFAYDGVTGGLVASIIDVDTTQTGDFTGLPSGWATPSGGGRHLKSTFAVDKFGRTTKATHPDGSIDYTVYDDVEAEVRVYPGWTGTTTTGPVQVLRRDRVGGDVTVGSQTRRYSYVEALTMAPSSIAVDGLGRPTGGEAVSNIQSLTREYQNQAGQTVWRDVYTNLAGLTYAGSGGAPNFALGTAGADYLRTQYGYDTRGRRNRVQEPSGVITRTVYDGLDRPVSTWIGDNDTPTSGFWSPTNAAGMVPVTEYQYDDGGIGDGDLTRVTDHPGGGAADRVTQAWFDWRGRSVAVKEGVETTESTSLNRSITYLDLNNLGEVTRARVYDGDGVTLSDSNADGVPDAPSTGLLRDRVDFHLDPLGRVFRSDDYGVNQSTGAVAGSPRSTQAWFDRRSLVIKTLVPGGLTTKTAYDGTGAPVAVYLGDGGSDTSWADARTLTGDTVLAQTETAYDANNQPIKLTTHDRAHGATGTGALGTMSSGIAARVSYAGLYYDAAGRLTGEVDVGTNGGTAWSRPSTVPARSDDELVTSYAYGSDGLLKDVTDAEGVVTRTLRDAAGRVTSTTLAHGTADAFATAYAYNSGGQLLSVTAPGGAVIRYAYDAHGWLASTTAAYGTGIAQTTSSTTNRLGEPTSVTAPGGLVTDRVIDVLGQATSVIVGDGTVFEQTTAAAFDTLGRVVSSTDSGGKVTTTAYDDVNRVVRVTDPAAKVWTTEFDAAGNLVSSSDPLANETTLTFDLLGRTLTTTDPESEVTTFEYWVTGDRDAVIDPEGNRTETVSDDLGRTAIVVGALLNETTYEHDRLGRVTAVVDRLGRRTEYDRDALGRTVVERWYSSAPLLTQTQAYAYDAAGNLESATDPDGDYAITYDALDRPITVEGPFGFDLDFEYDAAGNRTRVEDSQGGVVESAFDLLNRLESRTLETAAGEARFDYAYTTRNQVDLVSRFADLAGTDAAGTTVFNHDHVGRVTEIVHLADGGAMLADFDYAHDDAGRLTSRKEGGVTTSFAYDDAGQLTNDGGAAHGYDGAGNRTDTGYVTGDGNRLEADTTWTYTHDDAGQLVKKSKVTSFETWEYGYDHRGQMTWAERRATDGGTLQVRVEYAYDAFGNRIRRVERDGSMAIVVDERFVYDGWDTVRGAAAGTANFDVYADLDANDDVTVRRLFGLEADEVVARMDAAGDVAWYGTDRQGSVRLLWDAAGTVLGSRNYNGFGGTTASSGSGLDRYGYTGREWDAALGLQFTRARMYDPETGRFTSEDPLGLDAGDANVYRYVGNSPTNATDPSGMFALYDRFLNGWGALMDGLAALPDAIADGIQERGDRFAESLANLLNGDVNPDFVNGLRLLRDDPWKNGCKLAKIMLDILIESPWKLGEGIAEGNPRKILEGGAETGLMILGAKDLARGMGNGRARLSPADSARPGMAGPAARYNPPPHVVRFADEWEEPLDTAIHNRMRDVGVPEDMIGVNGVPHEDPNAFVRTHAIGGSNNNYPGVGIVGGKPGINTDIGVLDPNFGPMAKVDSWKSAPLKDRVDAVIAHEHTEVLAGTPAGGMSPHVYAVKHAPETKLNITPGARKILEQYRDALGLK